MHRASRMRRVEQAVCRYFTGEPYPGRVAGVTAADYHHRRCPWSSPSWSGSPPIRPGRRRGGGAAPRVHALRSEVHRRTPTAAPAAIERRVFRNPRDWSTEELFEDLAPSRRPGTLDSPGFLEGIVFVSWGQATAWRRSVSEVSRKRSL
ncbi:hypothetical protein GCM10010272_53240 [Streptomyces lateritius]|nr:hypothetical protein GCM10010272_53240 [Streptomyces lateritius]